MHDITKKLSKIASKKPIVEKQKRQNKRKNADEDEIKIQDTTWEQNANELNADEFENEDGEN